MYSNSYGQVGNPVIVRANWESDIDDVILEPCAHEEDPLGYRVVFYKDSLNRYDNDNKDSYSIGASYLGSRLEKLSRAGFDAPMTKKAMTLIDRTKFRHMR